MGREHSEVVAGAASSLDNQRRREIELPSRATCRALRNLLRALELLEVRVLSSKREAEVNQVRAELGSIERVADVIFKAVPSSANDPLWFKFRTVVSELEVTLLEHSEGHCYSVEQGMAWHRSIHTIAHKVVDLVTAAAMRGGPEWFSGYLQLARLHALLGDYQRAVNALHHGAFACQHSTPSPAKAAAQKEIRRALQLIGRTTLPERPILALDNFIDL